MVRHIVAASVVWLLSLSFISLASFVAAQSTDDDAPAFTEKRSVLGYGRLTTNDLLGDGHDRWRTGSITSSRVWGYAWSGSAPSQFGALLETRLQGQIIAPAGLTRANPADRPYAGILSVGLHTHFKRGAVEFAAGVDLAVIGPQTQLDSLQSKLHNIAGAPEPSTGVLALQIDNQVRPTIVTEMAQVFRLGRRIDIRPFAELRAGAETMARVGADFTIGQVTRNELLARESVTGQRYRVIYRSEPGVSFVFGGDVAVVSNSVYLPEDRGFLLTKSRTRLRAGLHWQGKNSSLFYGLSYLGQEFEAQPNGQIVGSVRLKFRF
ncbi:MAG: lipid A deacylase LpxR family protein [Rhodobacteraceae bacterium]|nr:lipid A deacylase LpxR family protein [Paracoccaceae bacterium]